MSLFRREDVVGTFRGFSEGGMEFHADLVFPYRAEFQAAPMHGQFVLAQLEHENEAVLGRITTVAAEGRLVSSAGEDYAIRAVREDRPIPDDLRDQYLKYKVNIRILGVLRAAQGRFDFVPSHRRLPHVGAKVAFLSPALLKEVSGANDDDPTAADLGFLSFGEFIHARDDDRLAVEPWMQVRSPAVVPRFRINQLLSRRTFVFARAGFGKSNLIKLLFANLYRDTPRVETATGEQRPVGTVIFDPDGEYFWPDTQGRPGLCDVPHLVDKLVVFTNRKNKSDYYQSFVVDSVKLDIRELPAAKVLGIAIPPERQDQQNVAKLKALPPDKWRRLVDAIYAERGGTDDALIREILGLSESQDAEMIAARSNMVRVVNALHHPASQLLQSLRAALAGGHLCVVDVSQMRGSQGMSLAGVILQSIFDHNQREFTEAEPQTIPTIAVIEEAQTVLGGSRLQEDSPFVAWVKEGRKYDLGAVLITQQPGSIAAELLSQGDNWFVFHLLAAGDLSALKRANAHFSDDLLASLLNEPLVGHGVFWSSAPGGKPYPLPIRALSFEKTYSRLDPTYSSPAPDNYASRLRAQFRDALAQAVAVAGQEAEVDGDLDAATTYVRAAVARLRGNTALIERVRTEGAPWFDVQKCLAEEAPPGEEKAKLDWAYRQVAPALRELLGGDFDSGRPDGRRLWVYAKGVKPDEG